MLKAKLKAKMKQDKKAAEAYEAREAFQAEAVAIIDDYMPFARWTVAGRIYDDLVMPLLRKRKKS